MSDYLNNAEVKELLTEATIVALKYYPLKGGREQNTDITKLTPQGFSHDRELMVVESGTGTMVTQRKDPRLALITTTFTGGEFWMDAEGNAVSAPILQEGKIIEATVHKSTGLKTIDQGEEVARFVSDLLGKSARVVRRAPDFERTIKQEYSTLLPEGFSNQVGFADGASMLLVSNQSVEKVNEWIQQDTPGYPYIPPANYRGNVEVDGFGFPFAEDEIVMAQSGNVLLSFAWKCSRCDVTTTNQKTGQRNPAVGQYIRDPSKGTRQPLHSLVLHRTGEYAPGKRGALFGINVQAKFLDDRPFLQRGAKITVLKTS